MKMVCPFLRVKLLSVIDNFKERGESNHKVMAVDIVPEKVELINSKKSPIQEEYIEKYLAEKGLDLTATLDAKEAYSDVDFVIIAAPTNVYSTNHIDVEMSKRTCFAHYIGC